MIIQQLLFDIRQVILRFMLWVLHDKGMSFLYNGYSVKKHLFWYKFGIYSCSSGFFTKKSDKYYYVRNSCHFQVGNFKQLYIDLSQGWQVNFKSTQLTRNVRRDYLYK